MQGPKVFVRAPLSVIAGKCEVARMMEARFLKQLNVRSLLWLPSSRSSSMSTIAGQLLQAGRGSSRTVDLHAVSGSNRSYCSCLIFCESTRSIKSWSSMRQHVRRFSQTVNL